MRVIRVTSVELQRHVIYIANIDNETVDEWLATHPNKTEWDYRNGRGSVGSVIRY